MSFLMVNPEAHTTEKGIGLRKIIEALKEDAHTKFEGEGIVYEVTSSEPMKRMLKGCGFKVGEKNMTSFIHSFGKINTDSLESDNGPR